MSTNREIEMPQQRCPWASDDGLYRQYHDLEWGRPVADDQSPLYRFFHAALHGERAEDHLRYHSPSHTWRP